MAGDTYTVPDMLARLVAFDTTSKFSNLALIDFVDDYLAGHGIASTRVPNGAGDKANLIASVGPPVEGGVVLSGHTDVVPVAGQDWDTDPSTLSPGDGRPPGRLHGRGTSDMKSFIAVGLALVPEFLARDLKVPIHFALSYDEEVGCLGAIGLLEKLCADLPPPMAAIVGEPSEMKVVNAHRGVAKVTTTVRGLPGHASATHRGVSAVAYAAANASLSSTAWRRICGRRASKIRTSTRRSPPSTSAASTAAPRSMSSRRSAVSIGNAVRSRGATSPMSSIPSVPIAPTPWNRRCGPSAPTAPSRRR